MTNATLSRNGTTAGRWIVRLNGNEPLWIKIYFLNVLKERILILDGGMGTMVQGFKLTEKDYRGEQFAGWASDLKGNNDLLCHYPAGCDQIDSPSVFGCRC